MDFSENLPGLVFAGDMTFKELKPILEQLAESDEVRAVKIGSVTMGVDHSLREVSDKIRSYGKTVIHDHQKMGQDIPAVTKKQAATFSSVADAVIVYPKSVEHWQEAYEGAGDSMLISVLYMTDGYDNLQERMGLTMDIITHANNTGAELSAAVLPANMPEITTKFIKLFDLYGIEPIVFSPGIKTQGGRAYDAAKAGTDIGIAGSGIYAADDPAQAAKEIFEDLKKGYKDRSGED